MQEKLTKPANLANISKKNTSNRGYGNVIVPKFIGRVDDIFSPHPLIPSSTPHQSQIPLDFTNINSGQHLKKWLQSPDARKQRPQSPPTKYSSNLGSRRDVSRQNDATQLTTGLAELEYLGHQKTICLAEQNLGLAIGM